MRHIIPKILLCGTVYLLLFAWSYLYGQSDFKELEELIDAEEDFQETDERIDYLDEMLHNPVDLNRGTSYEFTQIPGVSEFLARDIIHFREENGPFSTVDDLQEVSGIGTFFLDKFSRFFRTAETHKKYNTSLKFRNRIERQFENPQGKQDGSYPGPFYKQYSRLIFSHSRGIEGSILQEHDAGERDWADHFSGYITFQRIPGNHILTAGEYNVEAGQGLLLWGGRWFGYGNDGVYPVKRRARGIRGNRSSLEYGMFRGIAVERKGPGIYYYIFKGWNDWDSNLNEEEQVTSFYLNGYHRTDLELSKRNNLREELLGGHFGYSSENLAKVGVTYLTSEFNNPFTSSERDIFRFEGNRNENIGIDFDVIWRSLNVFGEIAQSSKGGGAGTGGVLLSFGSAEFVGHIRRYNRDFYSFHGRAFGRRSTENRNENGAYLGGNINFSNSWSLSFYHDRFHYPWRTYTVPFPVRGKEYMILTSYSINRNHTAGISYKSRRQSDLLYSVDSFGRRWDRMGIRERHRLRVYTDWNFSRDFRLHSRIEGVSQTGKPDGSIPDFSSNSEKGIFFMEDLRIRFRSKWRIYFRYGVFLSEDAAADFYTVQRDFTGKFTTMRLTGNGHLGTLVAVYQWRRIIQFSLKYSLVRYSGRSHIGTGRDIVQGPIKSYGGLQIDFAL